METPFYVVGAMGAMIVLAENARRAGGFARRRHGEANAPYKTRRATPADQREHLKYGGKFLRSDGSTVDRSEAYALAGMPEPAPRTSPRPAGANARGLTK